MNWRPYFFTLFAVVLFLLVKLSVLRAGHGLTVDVLLFGGYVLGAVLVRLAIHQRRIGPLRVRLETLEAAYSAGGHAARYEDSLRSCSGTAGVFTALGVVAELVGIPGGSEMGRGLGELVTESVIEGRETMEGKLLREEIKRVGTEIKTNEEAMTGFKAGMVISGICGWLMSYFEFDIGPYVAIGAIVFLLIASHTD
ncbi:MAG: hypothetical protein FJ109_14335 [Deltaproteobacteria bacterium]|nr:hypothetical protein [Deltaproteobacteria bacterium]